MSLVLLLAIISLDAPAAGSQAVAAPPEIHVIDEKEAIDLEQTDNVRLSLPTEDDVVAWRSPGLRVELGFGHASFAGTGPAWAFSSNSVFLRPSVRLDERWALGASMTYGTGPNGLRWSVTAEPTFFVWRQLALSFGLGYAGLSISDAKRSTGRLRGPDEVVSRDLVSGERLQDCTGSALTSTARTEYLIVAGPLFSTGPFVEGGMQWTRCEASFGRIDAETGRPVTLSQWWQQRFATLGWSLAWR
jgi:hypothetical protein